MAADAEQLELLFEGAAELPESVRIAIVLRGRHQGRVEIVASPVDIRRSSTATVAVLRWDAMFSEEGMGPILDLAEQTVARQGFDPERIVEDQRGAFYYRSVRTAKEQRLDTDRRYVPRVWVETPAQAEVYGLKYAITIRNMSPGGLLVECDPAMPELPERFVAFLSLPTAAEERLELTLGCKRAWSDEAGGVLLAGAQILWVGNEAEQAWYDYVASREYGQVIPEPIAPKDLPIKHIVID